MTINHPFEVKVFLPGLVESLNGHRLADEELPGIMDSDEWYAMREQHWAIREDLG